MKLSDQPYKGTSDWEPKEFAIREGIFTNWRIVCLSYGYDQYLTPLIEPIEIYKAKSGEDLGGKELMRITDRAGRELAIRPEMTPSVTRMVSRSYEGTTKPIRYFSIANFMRAERPQRGRNREFWQLNFDIFGSESIDADLEILMMALDIMLSFKPPEKSFTLQINHRGIISDFVKTVLNIDDSQTTQLLRIMDKFEKLSEQEIIKQLSDLGLKKDHFTQIEKFMDCDSEASLVEVFPKLRDTPAISEVAYLTESLDQLGYGQWIQFMPNVIRGLDYYDGMVFEVFDNAEDNNRSLFGGGRYNGLANIFGAQNIPAVGCAPGDEPLRLFIESWGLEDNLPKNDMEKIFIPIFSNLYKPFLQTLAKMYRERGYIVEMGLDEMKFNKALAYADKKGFDKIIIVGEDEIKNNYISIKDLRSKKQEKIPLK